MYWNPQRRRPSPVHTTFGTQPKGLYADGRAIRENRAPRSDWTSAGREALSRFGRDFSLRSPDRALARGKWPPQAGTAVLTQQSLVAECLPPGDRLGGSLSDSKFRRAVRWVAIANLGYFGIEFAVATAIGSVSLFAARVDFLPDASVNGLILIAPGWSATARGRLGKAFAGILLVPGLATLWTAAHRFMVPVVPAPIPLSLTGLGAFAVNFSCALLLARHRHHAGTASNSSRAGHPGYDPLGAGSPGSSCQTADFKTLAGSRIPMHCLHRRWAQIGRMLGNDGRSGW